jgi:ribonuclease VapC
MKLAVDASALLAVLLQEPDAMDFLQVLVEAHEIWISPVNWWETMVRAESRWGPTGAARAREFLSRLPITIAPVTPEQAELAYDARIRFGGRPHRLNLGDCFAYALSQSSQLPLLYKGHDFDGTDVASAR